VQPLPAPGSAREGPLVGDAAGRSSEGIEGRAHLRDDGSAPCSRAVIAARSPDVLRTAQYGPADAGSDDDPLQDLDFVLGPAAAPRMIGGRWLYRDDAMARHVDIDGLR
jgi:hypothetical protein